MTDQQKMKRAQEEFNDLCKFFEKKEWPYEKNVEELSIEADTRGFDLPINLKITVDVDFQSFRLLSVLPFRIPEDRRNNFAIAVNTITKDMTFGSFCLSYEQGIACYCSDLNFYSSVIGEDAFERFLFVSCCLIDKFNDKLLFVANNQMTPKQIRQYIDKVWEQGGI